MGVVKGLYEVAKQRKETKQEGSYTCYLFEQGLDKILKKCGEECSEVIIAAKNGNNEDTANEICDLLYHLIVMIGTNVRDFCRGSRRDSGGETAKNRKFENVSCQ